VSSYQSKTSSTTKQLLFVANKTTKSVNILLP